MKVAVLGNIRSPLTGRTVQALIERGVAPSAILLDAREESDKDLAIWQQRTGGRLPPLPLHMFAPAAIPAFFVENTNSQVTIDLVRGLGLELLVNGGCPRILSAEVLASVPHGVLNIHPGLLPEFRGASCVEWAIHKDRPVGNTIHFMTVGIDEGPVVLQESYTFGRNDRYQDIRVVVHQHGFALLARAVERVAAERMRATDARPQGPGNYYKPMPPAELTAVIEKLEQGRYRYQL
jgi:methionyl-tRNA formyltransferase